MKAVLFVPALLVGTAGISTHADAQNRGAPNIAAGAAAPGIAASPPSTSAWPPSAVSAVFAFATHNTLSPHTRMRRRLRHHSPTR
jgi:hypothetical protein